METDARTRLASGDRKAVALLPVLFLLMIVCGLPGVRDVLVRGEAGAFGGALVSWGLHTAGYAFFAGISAGAFFVATLPFVFGARPFAPLARLALLVALVAQFAASLFLVADLGGWAGVARYLRPAGASAMSTWLLVSSSTYTLILLAMLFLVLRPAGTRSRAQGRTLPLGGRAAGALRGLGIVGLVAAVCFQANVGALLTGVFLLSLTSLAATSGAAGVLGVALFMLRGGEAYRSAVQSLGRLVGTLLTIQASILVVETFLAMNRGPGEAHVLRSMALGRSGWLVWGVQIVVGSVLPAAVLLHRKPSLRTVALVSLLVLGSVFAFRLNILATHIVDQVVPRTPQMVPIASRGALGYLNFLLFCIGLGGALSALGFRVLPVVGRNVALEFQLAGTAPRSPSAAAYTGLATPAPRVPRPPPLPHHPALPSPDPVPLGSEAVQAPSRVEAAMPAKRRKVTVLPALGALGMLAGAYGAAKLLLEGNAEGIASVWGLPIVMYVFLVLTSAGCTFVGFLGLAFFKEEFSPIAARVTALAVFAAMGGMAVLVFELGRPWRGYQSMLTPNLTSPMAFLGFIYSLYIPLIAVQYLAFRRGKVVWPLLVTGVVAALDIPFAEGLLFGTVASRPYYFGGLTGLQFLSASFLTGAAVVGLMVALSKKAFGAALEPAARIMMAGLAVFLVVSISRTLTGIRSTGPGYEIYELTTPRFLVLGVLLGAVVPFALLYTRRAPAMVAAALTIVVTQFALRYTFVLDGLAIPVFGDQGAAHGAHWPPLPELLVAVGGVSLILFCYPLAERLGLLEPAGDGAWSLSGVVAAIKGRWVRRERAA